VSLAVAAVDFGASSIRICRVELGDGTPRLEVVHRHEHRAVRDADGVLRWDWARLLTETERGLGLALERGPLAAIGVDTWGVDYGLLDGRGELLAPPVSYRDPRTEPTWRGVVDRVGRDRLYAISGLQLLPFNTIFQLAAHDREQLAAAAHVVMLPELVVHHLTGTVTAEATSAGTTGLLDLTTGDWSEELCSAIGLPRRLLPELAPAGTHVGRWRDVPVHLVGGHDTASAVVAGSTPGHAFVSAGTWLIAGREQPALDTSHAAHDAGFSNEQALPTGVRLLRNVAGWWLVEECRRAWGDPPLADLVAEASIAAPVEPFDATDDRFVAPEHMPREVASAGGLPDDAPRGQLVRAAIDSMAATTVTVLDSLPHRDDDPPCRGIRLFGGGARAPLFLDALQARTALPVSVGPVEATALGNALVQGCAVGAYASLDEARATLLSPQEMKRSRGRTAGTAQRHRPNVEEVDR
jgi:rhamnulokinase